MADQDPQHLDTAYVSAEQMDSFNDTGNGGLEEIPKHNSHLLDHDFYPDIYHRLEHELQEYLSGHDDGDSNHENVQHASETTNANINPSFSEGIETWNMFRADSEDGYFHLEDRGYLPDLADGYNISQDAQRRPSLYEPGDPSWGGDASYPTASATRPTISAEEYRQLQPPEFVPIREIPRYDFSVPSGGPVNFTAVEVITLLPHLFKEFPITHRFCNNGMTASVHVLILEAHRHGLVFRQRSISDVYRDTMRRSRGGSPPEGKSLEWTKRTHRAPADWDHQSISMNSFKPDRLVRASPGAKFPVPVPFTDLLKGVRKLPRGPDSADLTAAILYAQTHFRVCVDGTVRPYLYPTHIQEILNIIGRTQVTPAHADGAIIKRYQQLQKRYRETKGTAAPNIGNAAEDSSTHSMGLPQPSSDSSYNHGYRQSNTPNSHEEQGVLPKVGSQLAPLIRNDPVPHEDDMSALAQVMRFSKRPDQESVDWLWVPEHVHQITETLKMEWTEQLNKLLESAGENRLLWREYMHPTNEIALKVYSFALSPMQMHIDWRIDPTHARILAQLNLEQPDFTLDDLASVVLNFVEYRQKTVVELPESGREILDTTMSLLNVIHMPTQVNEESVDTSGLYETP